MITNNAWHHAAVDLRRPHVEALPRRPPRPNADAGELPLSPRSDSIQRTALGSALNSSGTAAGFFRGPHRRGTHLERRRAPASRSASGDDDQITGAQTGLLARFGMSEGSGTTVANSAGSPSGVLRPSGAGPTWVSGYTFPQDTTAPPHPAGLTATRRAPAP